VCTGVKPGTRAAERLGAGTLMIGHPFNGHPGDTDFSGARLVGAFVPRWQGNSLLLAADLRLTWS